MPDDLVYAATEWVTNAQMIADVAKLGYLKDSDVILDPTYGKGGWWRVWHPAGDTLVGHQWRQRMATGVWWRDWTAGSRHQVWDFKQMWYADEVFDAVTFDPPYVSPGGRSTTGIPGMHAAYGMDDSPSTPEGVQEDIDAGLRECFRVVKKGGIVLVKCQDYVTSGNLWPGAWLTQQSAYAIGFNLVDILQYLGDGGPQPERETQAHARHNYSTLLVLERPKRKQRKFSRFPLERKINGPTPPA